jgi:uncharacterized protein
MHLFESKGSYYLFDPFSVQLAKLGKEDYKRALLRRAEFGKRPHAGRSAGAKSQRALDTLRTPVYKEFFPGPRTAARAQPLSQEVEILVNAAQSCNLSCPYCFVGQGRFHYGQKKDKSLDPRLAKRLVEILPQALPNIKNFCVHFYGGEPLLNPEAMRAAVEAADNSTHHFRFSVTTNGTLYRPEIFSLFKQGRFSVILSIDGPPRVHNALRKTQDGRPTHGLVLKFLKNLRKEEIFVRGSSVVRRGWSLREALAYLHSLPVDLIKAQAVRLPSDHPLALTETERAQYFYDLKELAHSVLQGLRKGTCPKDDRFDSRVLQLLSRIRRTSFCGAGRSIFGLAADGTVLPCALLAGFKDAELGRIDGSMDWVEKGRIWADTHGPRAECRACWALPLCGGGCPAMLSVCGEDECEMVRANCEAALEIYGAFLNRPSDLLILAGRF